MGHCLTIQCPPAFRAVLPRRKWVLVHLLQPVLLVLLLLLQYQGQGQLLPPVCIQGSQHGVDGLMDGSHKTAGGVFLTSC